MPRKVLQIFPRVVDLQEDELGQGEYELRRGVCGEAQGFAVGEGGEGGPEGGFETLGGEWVLGLWGEKGMGVGGGYFLGFVLVCVCQYVCCGAVVWWLC